MQGNAYLGYGKGSAQAREAPQGCQQGLGTGQDPSAMAVCQEDDLEQGGPGAPRGGEIQA